MNAWILMLQRAGKVRQGERRLSAFGLRSHTLSSAESRESKLQPRVAHRSIPSSTPIREPICPDRSDLKSLRVSSESQQRPRSDVAIERALTIRAWREL